MADKFSGQDLLCLRREIERKLDWGEVSTWHSKMYDELSENVFERTKVMLSVATLKRFFGAVNHSGTPSITTLDALSRFVGKENWREFKNTETAFKTSELRKPIKSVYVTVGFVLALVMISLIGNKRPEVIIDTSEFTFTSKVLSKEYPNSVIFDFLVPQSLRVDSLKIQQFWDPSRTIDISKDQTQATGIYYFPGYFKAKLLVDGQLVKSHDLFLKSNGWLGLVEYNPVPKYFEPQQNLKGKIAFPKGIVDEVKSLEKPVTSSFHFIDDLGDVSGDNFNFSTTIQNTYDEKWAVCQSLQVYFIGTSGAMIIPFSKIGCASDNNLMLNDVYLRGKENDLSALSANFSDPVDLEIKVVDKLLSVMIEGKNVYERTYSESMGKLVGVRFKFQGLGEVIKYDVRNHKGTQIQL